MFSWNWQLFWILVSKEKMSFCPHIFIVWNIKGKWHWVAKILELENQCLWQKLNSFTWVIKELKKNIMKFYLLRCDLSVLKYLSNKFLFELMSLSIEKLNLNLPSVRLLNQSLHKLLLRVGDIAGSFRIVSSSKKKYY